MTTGAAGRLTAGVDIGNATTEVVILAGADLAAYDRVATRGTKGSPESLQGAAALVRRLERRLGRPLDCAALAPLRAVQTMTATVPEAAEDTGRLRVVAAGSSTPGATGAGVGRPWWLGQAPAAGPDGDVVVIVPPDVGYERAAAEIRALLASGAAVAAVVVDGDEGVLIAHRIETGIPVVDEVDTAALRGASLVGVEARPAGQSLRELTDPVALADRLGLSDQETTHALAVARRLADLSNAVVGQWPPGAAPSRHPDEADIGWLDGTGNLRDDLTELASVPVGTARQLVLDRSSVEVDDLFALDLGDTADRAGTRRGSVGSRALVVAAMRRGGSETDHAAALSSLLGCEVHRHPSEAAAARAGALTTPASRPDGLVVDLGAGTIDVIGPTVEVIAAGAGDLLTQAVALVLGIPTAAADWVKRGPAVRIEGGRRFEAEDGSRGFLERPTPPDAVGMLAVAGPGGLLPFDRRHTPSEWRALRLRLKEGVLAANLSRILPAFDVGFTQVLVVGGPAGDDELLRVLAGVFGSTVPVGRGRVRAPGEGDVLGHRYAAALGLALGAL